MALGSLGPCSAFAVHREFMQTSRHKSGHALTRALLLRPIDACSKLVKAHLIPATRGAFQQPLPTHDSTLITILWSLAGDAPHPRTSEKNAHSVPRYVIPRGAKY